jgi:hypothetical protein
MKKNSRIQKTYHFNEPLRQVYNLAADKVYSDILLENLQGTVIRRNMYLDFPHLIESSRCTAINKSSDNSKQLTLLNFV